MAHLAQDGLLFDLFAGPAFDGFGASRFHTDSTMPGGHRLKGKRSTQLKKGVQEHAPRRPGVYAMIDARGRLIYVGKAKCLRTRLLSYFRTKSRDRKAGRIIGKTRRLLWEHCANELAALLRELELIQRHRPRYNVIGLPGLRRYCYIAIGGKDAAVISVTQEPTGKEKHLFGPFIGRHKVEEGVRRLNDAFKLRDCRIGHPIHFAEQPSLFDSELSAGCLRYELGTCLGPCGGGCTRTKYAAAMRNAKAFLDGRDQSLLGTLKTEMIAAATAQQYEKAGAIRDKQRDLDWLATRLAMLRGSRQKSAFVYAMECHDGGEIWLLLNRGQVWGVTAAPVTEIDRLRVAKLLALLQSDRGDRQDLARFVDSVLLVAAWFRKRPAEKAKLVPAETMRLRLLAEERIAA